MSPPFSLPRLSLSPPDLLAPTVADISIASVIGALPAGPLGAAAFFVAWLGVSYAIVFIFNRVLLARARRSANKVDDLLAEAFRVPLHLWLLLAGIWVEATSFAVFPEGWMPALQALILLLASMAGAHAIVRVALGTMAAQAERRPAFRAVQGPLEFAVRLIAYTVAIVLVLDHLGMEVTPILGALGIGGLAVALAMQDTLANFFAGMYLSLDRPLREGDFVELDGGSLGTIKGYVVDVSWRTVRVRELSNNIYVIPNTRVASGVIKNFDLPEPEMSIVPQVSVAYGADLAHVERVTTEVAAQVLGKVPGGVGGFQPFIRFHTFGDNGIGFSVILRVRTFVDQYLVQHEFIKALHARFREEGIEIPFPQRTLHWPPGARPSPDGRGGPAVDRGPAGSLPPPMVRPPAGGR